MAIFTILYGNYYPPWQKFRIKINSEPIRFIPVHSEICFRANPNSFESIRKKFSISFDVIRLKINPSPSEIFNPNQNSIRINQTQSETFNPNEFEVRVI